MADLLVVSILATRNSRTQHANVTEADNGRPVSAGQKPQRVGPERTIEEIEQWLAAFGDTQKRGIGVEQATAHRDAPSTTISAASYRTIQPPVALRSHAMRGVWVGWRFLVGRRSVFDRTIVLGNVRL